MSGILEKMRDTLGFGLDEVELYNRAFEKGVLLNDFNKAVQLFHAAAKKFLEKGDQMMARQALANAKLYGYLATKDPSMLSPLLQNLSLLQQIEKIGQMAMMPVRPLCAELDCRLVEASIAQAQGNIDQLRDLHKLASEKFSTIIDNPLITYEYVQSGDGHDEKASDRHFYHYGMYRFYEAMLKKDIDPAAAIDNLAQAREAFQRCNDQKKLQMVATYLDKWRIKRTCWMCGREIQGLELHFLMCNARVTPYVIRRLEELNQDSFTADLQDSKIAVCTTCWSMVTFRAAEEADKVRQELTKELEKVREVNRALNSRISQLEQKIRSQYKG